MSEINFVPHGKLFIHRLLEEDDSKEGALSDDVYSQNDNLTTIGGVSHKVTYADHLEATDCSACEC